MLIEQAVTIFERKLVPLRGIWVDPMGVEHAAKVTHLGRRESGYEIALENLWGGSIVPIPQVTHFIDADRLDAQHFGDGEIHYGSLRVEVDHFRQDPLEWLADAGIDIKELNSRALAGHREHQQ